ncbi:hypothetical protein HNQ60_001836 [Povalibacter uvarum]|uniref:DUF4180 domain-containing protein n=1 Tax=Povalibacter uvarum TaxID=732238 RepID=A0A841HL55_9GAMM|nr:DUF4180 domain-containing protein [Povalibacter uvarum]MBB6092958.1 hypothetical protein [Povalibacter uvarum]
MNSTSDIFEPGSAVRIGTLADINDVIGSAMSQGGLLLTEANLTPAFLTLQTRLAGELLQKCVNYGIRMALVMPDPAAHGARWAELALEHRVHPVIRMVGTREEAVRWLVERA